MSGFVPYRQPQSGMNYAQLMQLMQMKQMMDSQGQQQGQAKAPTSGIGDLLSSFGGGASGGSLANSVFGAGGKGVGSELISAGAPDYMSGFNLSGATPIPGAESAFASVGIPAAAVAATVLGGRSGLNMLSGKQKNWKDASLADNAGRVALAGATGGLSEVANKFLGGHKSTKQRQGDRWQGLAKEGKVPDWFLQQDVTQDQGVDDNKLASGKLGGRDVWATSGMFDTFGKDWATAGDENKREQVAKLMLDNKLFDTKQGVTNVTDKNKAMEIYNQVMGGSSPKQSPISDPNTSWSKGPNLVNAGKGGWGGANGPMKIAPDPGFSVSGSLDLKGMNDFISQQQKPAAPVRKDSPGFKDGKRIDYSRR